MDFEIRILKKLIFSFFIILVFALTSCSKSINYESLKEINSISESISSELDIYRSEVESLALKVEKIYSSTNFEKEKLIEKVNKSEYELIDNGVFYRKEGLKNSAVFVSGIVPVDETIKNIVYMTESIEVSFKEILEKHSVVAQVYYNDENSYNRIYPSFDVLSQYQVKMNIPYFNFYYLADYKHNPKKTSVWINEPYVDPAGRGWMVSTIAPVYEKDYLRGVVGIDLTILDITKKHFDDDDLMMMTSDGMIVTISEKLSTILSLPVLKDHKYIETIKSDSYMADDFNLMMSKNEDVRTFVTDIIESDEDNFEVSIDNKMYDVFKSKVENLGWIILKMSKK